MAQGGGLLLWNYLFGGGQPLVLGRSASSCHRQREAKRNRRPPVPFMALLAQSRLSRTRRSLRAFHGRWAETSSSTTQLLQVLLTLLAECLARFDCSTCAPSVWPRVTGVLTETHLGFRLQSKVALHKRRQQKTAKVTPNSLTRIEKFPDGSFRTRVDLRRDFSSS